MVVSGGAESSYLPRARSFDTFCAHEYPECSELTEWLILEWLRPVMKKEPAVIHQRICFMNGFARYLNNVGKPAFMMHNRFACGRTLFVPYIFSDDDLTRLFHVIDTNGKHGNPFQRIQFSVYYRLIYTCGLRPNEGRTLTKKHVDLHSGEIAIECSKERRSRIVVMTDDMRALAARYSSLLNACFPDTEFFFPSKHGQEYPALSFRRTLSASLPRPILLFLQTSCLVCASMIFVTALPRQPFTAGLSRESRLMLCCLICRCTWGTQGFPLPRTISIFCRSIWSGQVA